MAVQEPACHATVPFLQHCPSAGCTWPSDWCSSGSDDLGHVFTAVHAGFSLCSPSVALTPVCYRKGSSGSPKSGCAWDPGQQMQSWMGPRGLDGLPISLPPPSSRCPPGTSKGRRQAGSEPASGSTKEALRQPPQHHCQCTRTRTRILAHSCTLKPRAHTLTRARPPSAQQHSFLPGAGVSTGVNCPSPRGRVSAGP